LHLLPPQLLLILPLHPLHQQVPLLLLRLTPLPRLHLPTPQQPPILLILPQQQMTLLPPMHLLTHLQMHLLLRKFKLYS
jgi:hypothetical protein